MKGAGTKTNTTIGPGADSAPLRRMLPAVITALAMAFIAVRFVSGARDTLARGVSPQDAQARAAALTDAEAAELAARIDELPAGGIGIVGAILIVFLVLLLTDILGYTKIFPFTRSAK